MREVCFMVFSVVCFFGFSQAPFHRIYNYQKPYSLAHGVYPTDSCYYFGAMEGQGSQVDIVFGKMDLAGDTVFTTTVLAPGEGDFPYYAWSELQTNFRENFMFGYTARISGVGNYPKIVEMTPDGAVENSFLLDFLYDDSLSFADFGKLLVSNTDSSYYCLFSYADYTDNSVYELGAMLLKVNQLGDTLWTKRFHTPSMSSFRPTYTAYGMEYLDNNRIMLCILEIRFYSPSQAEQNWSKIHYIEVDLDGNLINDWEFQDTQHCGAGYNILPLSDGTYIHTYYESELTGTPPNNDYFWHRPVLSRLDANFQQLWKEPLRSVFANISTQGMPNSMISINDTVFAGAYQWIDIDWDTYKSDVSVRLFNRHINGEEIWHRDYHFFPLTDSLNEPDYTLKDFERTMDDGYILCGGVNNFDSISAGVGGQYAYFLKTNCLGFLGEPEAAAEHQIEDNYGVTFVNTSTQAGSYTWHFGDGETLWTDEYTDTAVHTFPGFGPYEVMLVAHGCNGAADTLRFTVEPTMEEDTTLVVSGNGYFSFFPNPVMSGSTLFVYLNGLNPQDGEVYLLFHAVNGALVERIRLASGQGNYLINATMARGMYHVSLYQGEKFLQTRKLMVE
jgi:hypothetical protein